MPLFSSGGGKLVGVPRSPRLSTHGYKAGYRGTSYYPVKGGGSPPSTMKRPHIVAPHKPVARTSAKQPTVAAKTPGTQDPFDFIKTLMQSTDPNTAKALIDQIYAPLRQQVNDQITQLQQSSQARAAQMQAIYGEFAQYMQGMAPQMQGIYSGDAKAQGFQDGQALAAGMAGPAGAVGSHLAANANIESNLNDSLGKDWGAWAAAQPGIYSLMATSQIKQMLGDATANEAKLRQDLLDLSSKEASDILQYLTNAQSKDADLQEWAYTQKQQQAQDAATLSYQQQTAAAKQQQAYLDYLQKQRQIDFNNAVVTGKLTLAQAKAKSDAQYKARLLQLKQQGLITDAQYKQAQIGLGSARVNIQQQNANTAKKRAAIAQQNANTAKKRAAIAQQNAAGKGAKTTQALRKQQTDSQAKATAYRDQLARQYYTHINEGQHSSKKGAGKSQSSSYTLTQLTPKQKSYIKAQVYRRFGAGWMRIAQSLIDSGQIKGNYTARQIADYWLNQSVGW